MLRRPTPSPGRAWIRREETVPFWHARKRAGKEPAMRAPLLSLCLSLSIAFPAAPRATAQPAPGYGARKTTLCPGSKALGGLEALPDGSYFYFDGTDLYRVKGTIRAKVYSTPSKVYGSFIAKVPGKAALLFGESSKGTITEIGIGVLPYFRKVTTLNYNYDCAFGPKGEILVSAPGPGGFGTNGVYLVDPKTGTADLLVQVKGPSGPVAVLDKGDLLLGILPSGYPPPPGSSRIVRFPLAKWRSAIGPGVLTEKDGILLAGKLDNVSHIALDRTGRVYFSDSKNKAVWALAPAPVLLYKETKETPTYLVLERGKGPARLRPYQPAGGDALLCAVSSWGKSNDLVRIESARPVLAGSPANPVPPKTALQLGLAGGPPGGTGILLFALGGIPRERPLRLQGLDFPLFLGLEPRGILPGTVLPLDASGKGTRKDYWPGGYKLTLFTQAFLLGSKGGILGSSNPYRIDLNP